MTREQADRVKMPFGKWNGYALCEVPVEYLDWLWIARDHGKGLHGTLKEAIRVILDADGAAPAIEPTPRGVQECALDAAVINAERLIGMLQRFVDLGKRATGTPLAGVKPDVGHTSQAQ